MIPKVLPKEQKGEYIQRCMITDSMVIEYPNQELRYQVCKNELEKHELTNGKNRKTKNTK